MKKILLIDEDRDFSQRIQTRMQEIDLTLDTQLPTSSLEGVSNYKIILVDLDHKLRSNIELNDDDDLIEKLNSIKRADQKMIALSSSRTTEFIEGCFDKGFDDYILKSNGTEEILNRIQRLSTEVHNQKYIEEHSVGHLSVLEPTSVLSNFKIIEKVDHQLQIETSEELPVGAMINISLKNKESFYCKVDSCKIINDKIVAWLLPVKL